MAFLKLPFICALLPLSRPELDPSRKDWLVHPFTVRSSFKEVKENLWRLSNGLVQRDFILSPNFATVDFYSGESESSLFRAFSPEAVLSLERRMVSVGGVVSQGERAYLNRSSPRPQVIPGPVFAYQSHTTHPITSHPITP